MSLLARCSKLQTIYQKQIRIAVLMIRNLANGSHRAPVRQSWPKAQQMSQMLSKVLPRHYNWGIQSEVVFVRDALVTQVFNRIRAWPKARSSVPL